MMDAEQQRDYRRHLVEAGALYEMTKGDLHLGFEWAHMGPDDIDEQVHAHLDRLDYSLGKPRKLHRILDLACANGTRLLRYAQMGIECVGVDYLDTSASINSFNSGLVQKGMPPIAFIQSDIRKLNADDFVQGEFAVINCTQAMHYMDKDDIIHLLRFMKKIAGPNTLITFSLDTVNAEEVKPYMRQQIELFWQERARVQDKMGYNPSSKFQMHDYMEFDIETATRTVGLHLHNIKTAQTGATTVIASISDGPIFSYRPKLKAVDERFPNRFDIPAA